MINPILVHCKSEIEGVVSWVGACGVVCCVSLYYRSSSVFVVIDI